MESRIRDMKKMWIGKKYVNMKKETFKHVGKGREEEVRKRKRRKGGRRIEERVEGPRN